MLTGDDGRLRLGWRLLSFVLVALGVTLVLGIALPVGVVWASLAMLVAGVAAGGFVLATCDGRSPASLRFYVHARAPGETALGFALGVAIGLFVVLGMAGLGAVRWSGEPGTVAGWLAAGGGALAFLAIPAAAEEALLRGYPLQALSEAWGPVAALLATSVVFGAVHLLNPGITALGVANIAVAGVFLGVVYLKTYSLWWATGAHLGWNWSHGFLVDVPVSGLDLMDAPFYDGAGRGPDWLGGGPFGPEGSVVTTVLVLAAAVVCWRSPLLRPSAPALAAEPLVAAPTPATNRGGT